MCDVNRCAITSLDSAGCKLVVTPVASAKTAHGLNGCAKATHEATAAYALGAGLDPAEKTTVACDIVSGTALAAGVFALTLQGNTGG